MNSPAHSIAQALEAWTLPSTSVAGVGVDLVDVGMLATLLASGGSTFLDTVWTDIEQRDAGDTPDRLAARWAAKEAVMKALGRGIGDIDPLDIEVAHDHLGAPVVRLYGSAARAAEQAGVETVHVSMSHDEGWAVAFAVGSRPSDQSQGRQNGKDRRESHGG